MRETLVNDSFVNPYGRIGENRDPLQAKIGKGDNQKELRQRMRAINGIALGSLIGIGLWSIIIAVFVIV